MNNTKHKVMTYKFDYDENGKFKEMVTKEEEMEISNIELKYVRVVQKGTPEYKEALKKGLIKEGK